MPPEQSFPRHSARTQGFTLGAPRTFTVTASGDSVLFLRSASGTDRANALWVLDTRSGTERCLADPVRLHGEETVSPEEQARRERARERAGGITGYATDGDGTTVAFTLSGRLFVADPATDEVRELPARVPAADPRPDPTGRRVAYTSRGALRVIDVDGRGDRSVAEPDHEHSRWGVAEFIAAEEMQRTRGYWWSPDGSQILAAHVDETTVQRWYLGDPTHPAQEPRTMRYPAAGSPNATVALALLDVDGSSAPRDVPWDHEQYPYLVAAHWSRHGDPLAAVQTRDQRTQLVLAVDPATGRSVEIHRETDPCWVEIKPGWPAWTPTGELVRISARDGAYRLVVGDADRSGPSLQVRAILDIGDDDVLVSASDEDPTQVHVYRIGPDGVEPVTREPGVHAATRSGSTVVVSSSTLASPHARVTVLGGTTRRWEVASRAETPGITANVELLRVGERRLASALLLPRGYHPEDGRLPVLLDPYGGPQAQRVLARQQGMLTSQWFADQGYAVLVTDGRGMTGRGPQWDRAVAGDLAGPPLQDQVDALHAVAAEHPELDLTRVAIRGWSFGGYLAALAVLRRPDVFHAAIAGASVCDWNLYDTHYTERYLGDPSRDPDTYERNSLIGSAPDLRRPLLIVHGMVDDNVVPAHSLRLSDALTAAARPHTMLPLPGVSHVPTSENATENLLLLQLRFLRGALSAGDPSAGEGPAGPEFTTTAPGEAARD